MSKMVTMPGCESVPAGPKPSRKYTAELTIYAAASGFLGSCFSLSVLKPNLASSSCTIRAVCALCRMWVNNAPRAIPNISIPSNNRTSGTELTIETVYQQSCCCFQVIQGCSEIGTNHALARILNVYEHRNLLTLFGFCNGMEKSSRKFPTQEIMTLQNHFARG